MTCAAALDIEICKGATLSKTLRWESGTVVFKTISGITKAAPPVVTATAHGAPNGWRVAITNVKGMTQINAANNPPKNNQYHKAANVAANTLELSGVDATGFGTYTSGGILRYNQPVDLTSYTARMQIRATKSAATFLLELTTANGRIALDNTLKTITLTVSATDTAAITWTSGVYDLELVSPGGVVTRLVEGAVTVSEEATK